MTFRAYQAGYISSVNSTQAPLGIEETFTGIGELSPHHDVLVTCKSDADGMMHVDFGITKDEYDITCSFPIVAGIGVDHILEKGSRYCRVRLVNGDTAQTYLRLQTEFGDFKGLETPIKALKTWKVSRASVTTTAAVVSSAVMNRRAFSVKAMPGNDATVFIAETLAKATSNDGWPLQAGESIDLELEDLASVYAVAASGTQALALVELAT
jgi:hypothetical protein